MEGLIVKLIDEWETVLKKAWSMKAAFALAILGAAQAGLPYFGAFIPPVLMGSTTAVVSLLLIGLRLMDQGLSAVATGGVVAGPVPIPAPESTDSTTP
jgi:hypothetical protein